MTRAGLRLALFGGLGGVAVALAACSGGDTSATDAAWPDASSAATATATVVPGGQEAGGGAAPVVTRVRDGDVRDVDVLAAEIAAGAEGDAEWIAVLARLQALDWLAARYPGEYDLHEIYSETWAAEHVEPAQEERLSLGVYLDSALPSLVSVVATGELGVLTQLDVVVEIPEATVRQLDDDTVTGTRPGSVGRGLFFVGLDGPDDQWRVHSVVEQLLADDTASAEEPLP